MALLHAEPRKFLLALSVKLCSQPAASLRKWPEGKTVSTYAKPGSSIFLQV